MIKIVSGGQSGADIGGTMAALDARKRGLPVETGGWGHPTLDSEYAPRTWRGATPNPVENIPENDRIVALQREAGLKEWPHWVKGRNFSPNERPDIVDVYRAVHGNKPPAGQHFSRTAANVIDSDATVLFGALQGGTLDTKNIAVAAGKPSIANPTPEQLAEFVRANNVLTLNVAGRRESKSPRGQSHQQLAYNTISSTLDLLADEAGSAPPRPPSPPFPATEQLTLNLEPPEERMAGSPKFQRALAALGLMGGVTAAGTASYLLTRPEQGPYP